MGELQRVSICARKSIIHWSDNDMAYYSILPWQFDMLGLKENGGNRLIKYADALIDGVSSIPHCGTFRILTFLFADRLRLMMVSIEGFSKRLV